MALMVFDVGNSLVIVSMFCVENETVVTDAIADGSLTYDLNRF